MSTRSVFNTAKRLVELPHIIQFDGNLKKRLPFLWPRSSGYTSIKPVEIDAPDFADVPKPDKPDNTPLAASYQQAVDAVLSWATPPVAIAPEYGQPAKADDSLPDVNIPLPPLDYPVRAQLNIAGAAGSAGLEAIDRPNINIGNRPTLTNASIAAFEPEDIELFDIGGLPDYEPFALSPLAEPDKIDYTADAALLERMKQTLAGSDVLDANVQEMLWQRETHDLDRQAEEEKRKVLSGFASRGFSMPLGAANSQVAEIARQVKEKKLIAAFKVRDEVYERAHKLLVDTVGYAMALESKHAELHLSYCKKLVEVLKYDVRAAATLFDATVKLFNDKAAVVRLIVRGYREYLKTVEAQDSAALDAVKVEMGKISTYRAQVGMYQAQVGTLKAIADTATTDARQQALKIAEYEAYLVGVMADIQVTRENLDNFREAVRAFAKGVSAEGEKFQAYEQLIRAQGSATTVDEANVSAWARYWRTEEGRVNAWASYVNDHSQAVSAQVQEFREYTGAYRSYLSALGAKISAQTKVIGTWARGVRQKQGWSSAWNRVQVEYVNAQNAYGLGIAANRMEDSAMESQQKAEEARIEASRLASDARIKASLAQAALAVISASVSITGSIGSGRSASSAANLSVSKRAGRSYSKTRSLSNKEEKRK